jgi:hypothetical protein
MIENYQDFASQTRTALFGGLLGFLPGYGRRVGNEHEGNRNQRVEPPQTNLCLQAVLCEDADVRSSSAPSRLRRIDCIFFGMEGCVSESLHPAAPHHLPSFITAPGDTDILMVVVGIVLIGSVLAVGNLYLHLHTLPERMAHKSQKFQFEVVAVLGLLALFTHNHLFWVIGLFLAMIDLPDFGTPLRKIAGSVEKMAGVPPEEDPTEMPGDAPTHATDAGAQDPAKPGVAKSEVKSHA